MFSWDPDWFYGCCYPVVWASSVEKLLLLPWNCLHTPCQESVGHRYMGFLNGRSVLFHQTDGISVCLSLHQYHPFLIYCSFVDSVWNGEVYIFQLGYSFSRFFWWFSVPSISTWILGLAFNFCKKSRWNFDKGLCRLCRLI